MRNPIITIAALSLLTAVHLRAERRAVPSNAASTAAYSPAILTDEYLYVSGQLGRIEAGAPASTVEEQATLILNQLKSIVESAGLTMDHVVYTQLFLTDMRNYEAVNKVYAAYFPKAKPARVTVGVARLPFSCSVELSAVAVRDLQSRQVVNGPQANTAAVPIAEAIKTRDRVFLSGTLGRDSATGKIPKLAVDQARLAFDRSQTVLKAAGLTEASFVSVNVYYTSAISQSDIDKAWSKEFGSHVKAPVSYIRVNQLALGANVGITGVAALNSKQARIKDTCVSLGETLYCAVEESGMGKIDRQTSDTMTRLLRNASSFGFTAQDISLTQLYVDSMDDFAAMNTAYVPALPAPRPARITIQAAPSGDSHRLFQATLIASRPASDSGSRKAK